MEALSTQAMRIIKLFGDTTATKVVTSVGPEQEYFLVDKDTYDKRKDLIFTGRTLFGAPAPRVRNWMIITLVQSKRESLLI